MMGLVPNSELESEGGFLVTKKDGRRICRTQRECDAFKKQKFTMTDPWKVGRSGGKERQKERERLCVCVCEYVIMKGIVETLG